MNIGKIEFEEPSEDGKREFFEKFMEQKPKIEFVQLGKPKFIPLGLQCPVCDCGVSPDSKVCPNCLRNFSKTEVAPDKPKTVIKE